MFFRDRKNRSQQRVCAIVRILFAVFFFLYFYLSQAASLFLAQHQLSQGQTTYHPLIGAIVLTVLMLGLQRLVHKFVRFRDSLYVLTFFPSSLVAVLLTSFTPFPNSSVHWTSCILTLIWVAIAVYDSRSGVDFKKRQTSYISHIVCFLLLTIYLGLCGNSRDVINYEVYASRYINDEEYDKALKVGEKSLATSNFLTALRAYAQSHQEGGLADKLFEWPLPHMGSEMLFIRRADTVLLLFEPDSLYNYLGCYPDESDKTALMYFKRAAHSHPESPAKDYWLCALLLDKKLDEFASELPNFYEVSDSVVLPHYYAEALVLYNRTCTESLLDYSEPTIVANYLDFKEKGENIPNTIERRNLLWREYGNTYWWYYIYHEQN